MMLMITIISFAALLQVGAIATADHARILMAFKDLHLLKTVALEDGAYLIDEFVKVSSDDSSDDLPEGKIPNVKTIAVWNGHGLKNMLTNQVVSTPITVLKGMVDTFFNKIKDLFFNRKAFAGSMLERIYKDLRSFFPGLKLAQHAIDNFESLMVESVQPNSTAHVAWTVSHPLSLNCSTNKHAFAISMVNNGVEKFIQHDFARSKPTFSTRRPVPIIAKAVSKTSDVVYLMAVVPGGNKYVSIVKDGTKLVFTNKKPTAWKLTRKN